jgi:hypothetical protein
MWSAFLVLFICRQLKIIAPSHPIVKRLATGEEAFTRAAAAMA